MLSERENGIAIMPERLWSVTFLTSVQPNFDIRISESIAGIGF